MIETLSQYGLLGVIIMSCFSAIVYLVKRDERRDALDRELNDKFAKVVENNTIAITKFNEMTKKCQIKT